MNFIDLKSQYEFLRDSINPRLNSVLEHGQYVMGPEVRELEGVLAAFVGSKYCITCSSGTDALLLSLMALDIKPGDEVVTTPFSFFATAEAITLLGAIPVFVDIEASSYNMDPALLEDALSERTKAIIPVSLYGQCADYDAINAIAEKHEIPVIEDAAQSFGAEYKGQKSCGLTTIAATSFFPSKPLGCYGDGGACFTNSETLADKCRALRDHGQQARYEHQYIGLNARLDTMQAAVLLAKMEIFEGEIEKRNIAAARYYALLEDSPGKLKAPLVHDYNKSVFAQFTLRLENRDEIQSRLKEKGVPTAVHYPVLINQQAALQRYPHRLSGNTEQAAEAANSVLSIPMHPYLDEATQAEIVTKLIDSLE